VPDVDPGRTVAACAVACLDDILGIEPVHQMDGDRDRDRRSASRNILAHLGKAGTAVWVLQQPVIVGIGDRVPAEDQLLDVIKEAAAAGRAAAGVARYDWSA